MMKMAKVKSCNAAECAYNIENRCHALAITIGGEPIPTCDTLIKAAKKGGVLDTKARVGACKVENCEFNKSLECTAKAIKVKMDTARAECITFKAR
ncbi:MAG: DUF1540 domain-containing protein [bacterium]